MRRWNGRPSRTPRGRRARSGLGSRANAGVLAGVLGAWAQPEHETRALGLGIGGWGPLQLAAVGLGFGLIVLAASPLPGARTRPGVYLSSALADPLRDFFARHRSAGGLILALICTYRISDLSC